MKRHEDRTRTPRVRSLLVVAVLMWGGATVAMAADWRSKIDSSVLATAETGEQTEFLIFLKDQADLSGTPEASTKVDKGRYVFEHLRAAAARSQGSLIEILKAGGYSHRSFWIANMIWVRGDLEIVQQLARRPEVARLHANPHVAFTDPEPSGDVSASTAPQGIEWNIVQVGAPVFWTAGFTGQGVVIAGQDTGYDWDHPALKNQYRGWSGTNADHDYNWHDSIHETGSSCGADSPVPCDDGNHGTHTLGTMVGDDGGANQIGVAPGARWIGCRNMNSGDGTPASYAECFQFFMAPTRVDGTDPDPSRAPHVINNSWSCPPSEGCTDPNVLHTVVSNTRAAGIVVVVSAGNSGSQCGSVSTPAAIYEESMTVGATDSADIIAGFSSRGGVTVDGSNRLKPNVTAPGVGIRSSLNNGSYSGHSWNGTSMAGPHVAGQVALIISAMPALAGRVETLEACIEATATPLTSSQECSGIPGSQVPNNTYGRGRIDLSLPLPYQCSAAFVFADDFEAGAPSGWSIEGDPLNPAGNITQD